VSDYSAAEGYTLTYVLSGQNKKLTLTSTADGADHKVTISAATSAVWVPGWYKWQAYITKGDERYTIDIGRINVLQNLTVAGGAQEGRSLWQITVDNLEAVITNKSTEGYANISVSTPSGTSRAIGKMSWQEILSTYAYAKRQLSIETNGNKKKRILTQFSPL
jgi:hypothetical protein